MKKEEERRIEKLIQLIRKVERIFQTHKTTYLYRESPPFLNGYLKAAVTLRCLFCDVLRSLHNCSLPTASCYVNNKSEGKHIGCERFKGKIWKAKKLFYPQ